MGSSAHVRKGHKLTDHEGVKSSAGLGLPGLGEGKSAEVAMKHVGATGQVRKCKAKNCGGQKTLSATLINGEKGGSCGSCGSGRGKTSVGASSGKKGDCSYRKGREAKRRVSD